MEIRKARKEDVGKLVALYERCKSSLFQQGIYQWTESYPNVAIVESDIEKGYLYVLIAGNEIAGVVNLSEEQEEEYATVNWAFDVERILVIHRLAVDPEFQGQGFARRLMDFAENYAVENAYQSIRLDTYSKNERNVRFYNLRGYEIRGEVFFPEREHPFFCLEKGVSQSTEVQ